MARLTQIQQQQIADRYTDALKNHPDKAAQMRAVAESYAEAVQHDPDATYQIMDRLAELANTNQPIPTPDPGPSM